MKPDDKAKRWTRGTGKITCTRNSYTTSSMVEEKTGENSSVIRANIWRKGPKNYRLTLFQGRGHKDTIYETNRWMNVRETLGNHLCDIDRALERPLTKWRLPTEEECFAPQRGDVVVIKGDGRNDLYYQEGGIGLVRDTNDPSQPGRCQVQIEEGDNGWVVLKNDEIEVIDHDEDLLKEPDPVEDVPPEELKKARDYVFGQKTKVIEPLDLPGGKGSWLLAIDISGSMVDDDIRGFLANHLDELKYKVAETVTFDTTIRHKYAGMPGSDLDLSQPRCGTEINCVLGHALVLGYHNVLVFSDGCFNNQYALKKDSGRYLLNRASQSLNVLIVKTPDGKPETLIKDKCLPPTPKEVVPPGVDEPLSTEIINTVLQVENNGYSWAIAHVLNEKELCLVRTCRHCTEKKAIRLVDIKF